MGPRALFVKKPVTRDSVQWCRSDRKSDGRLRKVLQSSCMQPHAYGVCHKGVLLANRVPWGSCACMHVSYGAVLVEFYGAVAVESYGAVAVGQLKFQLTVSWLWLPL